ncbi:MAG: efflux RND transporter periplasmic adaptor subunit [Rhodoferax sp.]
MTRIFLLALTVCVGLCACDKLPGVGEKKDKNAAPAKLLVAPEDTLTLRADALASGPVVTGSIQPERNADLRAEVQAVVLQVLRENGDSVKRGDVLVRLDETAIRDNLSSAEDAARNAALALDQAERNLQRLKTLREAGMTSLQTLDDAEVRRNAAQSDLSAAGARAVQARQQLQRTVVRAPFDGVVSERKVSAGDTASIGKELLKVMDPRSMRFAGRISADKVSLVRVGQAVNFRVNGYPAQQFRGSVTRVDASANDVTRQVEVLVGFSDATRPQVAGLYAEGSIEAAKVKALMLPEATLVRSGDKTSVWRIQGGVLQRVALVLGQRDPRTGFYEVRSGLDEGDLLLRNPGVSAKEAQAVELLAAAPAAAQPASSAQGK